MAQELVILEYNFMFDPSQTWTQMSAFEKELADFFATRGLEAQVINSMTNTYPKRILFIKNKVDLTIKQPIVKEKSPVEILNKIRK